MKIANHEFVDSVLSYGGGSTLIVASLSDIATFAQQVGIILGCLLVVIKLIYDIMKLRRDFFSGSDQND